MSDLRATDEYAMEMLSAEAAILAEARGIRLGPVEIVHKYWRDEWWFTFPVLAPAGYYGRMGKTERAGLGKFRSFAEIVAAVRADLPSMLDEIEKAMARRRVA